MLQESEDIFDLNEKVLITFKNEEYILNAYALLSKDGGLSSKESLVISIKKESTNEIWKGKYTNNYVEEITKKTGNFKKFSVFIEMLFSAIKMSSKTVTLDLLTLDDVKRLRENKGDDRLNTAESNSSNKPMKNKLFLILTYSAAFDRVHYPLPLTFQGFEDEISSIALVEKLKKEIELLKEEKENNINEISKLLRENDKLKYEMKQLQDINHDTIIFNAFEEKTEFKLTRITQFIKKEFDVILKLYRQKKMHTIINDKLITLQRYILQAFSKYENDKKKLEEELLEKNEENEKLKNKIKLLQSRSQSLPKKKSSSSITKQRSSSIYSLKKEVKSSGYSSKPTNYNIIKSRPLKPLYMTRDKSKRSTSKVSKTSKTSRNNSMSSFKRFDPTAYVREREQKLEERRARSREMSISRFSRNNSIGVTSNISTNRSLSNKNIKSIYSSESLYGSRSKSIDRNSVTKKKQYSDSTIRVKYERSSSTVRNNATKGSRNNSLSKMSYTSSHTNLKPSVKRSTSKVAKSRNSSLSKVNYSTRDSSIGRRTNISNLSQTSISKKYSKLSQQNKYGNRSSSITSSSRNTIPVKGKSSKKVKAKSKERVIIRKNLYDDKSLEKDVYNKSQCGYDCDFEELKTEEDSYNPNTTITITEKDDQWNNHYNINDSQDIDARLEAIQKYLKDTQDEL